MQTISSVGRGERRPAVTRILLCVPLALIIEPSFHVAGLTAELPLLRLGTGEIAPLARGLKMKSAPPRQTKRARRGRPLAAPSRAILNRPWAFKRSFVWPRVSFRQPSVNDSPFNSCSLRLLSRCKDNYSSAARECSPAATSNADGSTVIDSASCAAKLRRN